MLLPEIPLEDALLILDKWREEQRIVQVLFVDAKSRDEFTCTLLGLIQEVHRSEVHIHEGRRLVRGDFPGCILSLRGAQLSLGDYRNTPHGAPELKERIERAYEHVLVVRLPSGAECELYIFKEGTELPDTFGSQ